MKFHPADKLFVINEEHPLVREYSDVERASERLLQDFVTAEALLEVYLREAGVGVRIIGEILEERDKLIRSLARAQMYSLTAISEDLRKSVDKQYDLEVALIASARALGFIAKHVSGGGRPDGIARFIDNNGRETVIILEAKSSAETPSLSAIDFAGIREHMSDESAVGCMLVAPSYPGPSKGDDAAAAKRAIDAKCSCWTVDQLADVVNSAETREISARDVLHIVENYYSPDEVTKAVSELLEEPALSAAEIYIDVVDAMEQLVGRQLGKPLNIDMVLTKISDQKAVNSEMVNKAVRVVAKASRGLVRVSKDGSEIILLGAFEELRRRLGSLITSPITARRMGNFRKLEGE